ncbi:MAG: hypothetical protein ACRDRX_01045 [Pseudonocardiaceae bacterium]
MGDEMCIRDTATVVVASTAEGRLGAPNARVAVNGVVAEPEAVGVSYLDVASANTDVAELLTLVGDADKLTENELYKAFEIIRDAVGGGRRAIDALHLEHHMIGQDISHTARYRRHGLRSDVGLLANQTATSGFIHRTGTPVTV